MKHHETEEAHSGDKSGEASACKDIEPDHYGWDLPPVTNDGLQWEENTIKLLLSNMSLGDASLSSYSYEQAEPYNDRMDNPRKRSAPNEEYKLFISGIPTDASSADLEDLIKEYGEILDFQLVTDRETGLSKGFGFATMSSDDACEGVISQLNGYVFNGSSLRVQRKRSKNDSHSGNSYGGYSRNDRRDMKNGESSRQDYGGRQSKPYYDRDNRDSHKPHYSARNDRGYHNDSNRSYADGGNSRYERRGRYSEQEERRDYRGGSSYSRRV